MMRANGKHAWMWLLLVLPLGASASQTADVKAEPNDPLKPASLLNRSMSAGTEKTSDAGRPLPDEITQRLWRSRIAAPAQPDDRQIQTALNELMTRVRSVRFEAKEQTTVTFTVPEPVVSRPDTASDPASPEPRVQSATTAPGAPDGALSKETLEALKRVLADPNQASEPLALAELLYLTGRVSEAAVLYQKALDSTSGNEPASREDRAWILLQLGNCLRETDPARARDMYTKLVAEHADSPWVELAKAHSQLISWYEQVQPRQWLAGSEITPTRQVAASQKPQP